MTNRAHIEYVMAGPGIPEQHIITVTSGGEVVHTVRIYTRDYDDTPGYEGAMEATWEIAEMLVGSENVETR